MIPCTMLDVRDAVFWKYFIKIFDFGLPSFGIAISFGRFRATAIQNLKSKTQNM
jgi:hypothetical protein